MIKTYLQIINETLDEEMAINKNIVLIGEDIATYGGAFGVTKGLFEKYGPSRVINTPMSEQSFIGLGVGAALNGLKPIVELMFMDFVTLAYDQLFHHASIFEYITNGEVKIPLIIRTPAGGGRGYGATHSKTIISPLMHIPNIKIVAPSRPRDVKGLLKSCLKEQCPVIFVEHKLLYQNKEDIDGAEDFIPLGKAKIIKEGKDLVLISFSKTLIDCLKIAEEFEKRGVSLEVIDLRTISPLDMETINQSIKKIGKVLVVEEGYPQCGVASEIISRINEESFYYLKCPMRRVSTSNEPIPCSIDLEREVLPSKEKVEKAIMEMINE